MKKKPFLMYLISFIHFLIPLWYTYQLLFIYQKNVMDFGSYDLFYIALMSLWAIAAGVGIYRVSIWGLWLFVGHAGWVILSYLILFIRNASVPAYLAVFGLAAALVALILPFLFKNIFSPFFNPRLRWWRTPPRFLLHGDRDVKTIFSEKQCSIYDININGCYVVGDFREVYKAGEEVVFQLFLNEKEFEVKGSVVWMNTSEEKSQKPLGMGVKFVHVSHETHENLGQLVRELAKEGNRLR